MANTSDASRESRKLILILMKMEKYDLAVRVAKHEYKRALHAIKTTRLIKERKRLADETLLIHDEIQVELFKDEMADL